MLRILIISLLLCTPLLSQAENCKQREHEDFSLFLSRYINDKQFSISRTIFPLRKLTWEYGLDAKGNDASGPVQTYISKIQFSASPNLSTYMKENGLVSNVKALTARSAVVEIYKPDTDWITTHHFSLRGNCWFLYEYQDHSL